MELKAWRSTQAIKIMILEVQTILTKYFSVSLHFSYISKVGLKYITKHSSSSFLKSKSRHMTVPLGWTHICATSYI